MFDVIVIGAGPAGMAAAVYLARQKVSFVMLSGDVGGKTLWSSDVENYLGFHLLSGVELVQKFREHLKDYKDQFEIREGELVTGVTKLENGFQVTTEKGAYEGKTVLITTGEENRKLNIPGEKDYYGKGVTYCATCDAPLFANKVVHVIGGGNSAMDAALFLEKYASRITIVSINPELRGDELLKKRCLASPKITVLGSTKTTKIEGAQFVTGIGLQKEGEDERVEETQGVFVEVGLIPVSQFIDIVGKDKRGQIIVDRNNRTSTLGIWAAGDVTDVTTKQVAVAVGEGSKAALDIIHYLQQNTV